MKKKFNLFALFPLFLFMLAIGIEVMAQIASPTPAPSPVPVAAAPSIWDALIAHKVLLGSLIYNICDLLVWLIPSLAGYGLLHQIQLWAGAAAGKPWGQA